MRTARFVGCLVGLGAASVAMAAHQTAVVSAPHPRGYVSYRASSLIEVDGRLDDASWRDAPWTDTFVDIEGDKKPRPRLETRVKMLWDDAYFYIAADLRDPHLWGTLTEHDAVIFQDNDFEVFIDPNGDNHEYYEFEINARGTFWDLLLPKPYKDDGKALNNWEIPGLKSAVHLDGTLNDPRDADRAWSVELALPWKVLAELARRPSPPKDGDQWRVNFSRVAWPLEVADGAYRKPAKAVENNWVWSPQHVVDMHRPEWWGYVQFATGKPGSVTFVPDAAWEARQWLHALYYAQRDYRKANWRWAGSLDELRFRAPAGSPLGTADLKAAGSQFEASVELRIAGQPSQRWHIRQDALIWKD